MIYLKTALLFLLLFANCGGAVNGEMACALKCAANDLCVYSYKDMAEHCVCGPCD